MINIKLSNSIISVGSNTANGYYFKVIGKELKPQIDLIFLLDYFKSKLNGIN